MGEGGHDRPAGRPQEKQEDPRDQQVETQLEQGGPRIARHQDAGERQKPASEAEEPGQPL